MPLLPVSEALAHLLDGAKPTGKEDVPLAEAGGRVLAQDVSARRTQPPFDASAMDGYAARAADVTTVPTVLSLIGTAAAGRRFEGRLDPHQAVRIFTGAPIPEDADTVVIQENVRVLDDHRIEVLEPAALGKHIRRTGLDFQEGDVLLRHGRLLDPAALALAASGNHPALSVFRKPLVAIVATGDELLPPGSEPGPDQIIASNTFGVAAIARNAGAEVLDLGIAPDRKPAISAKIEEAISRSADLIVTVGGASVGDHDLVHDVLAEAGLDLSFWKIAMRPGKPLMFGRLGPTRCVGLPGNPVASLICSHVFLKPLIARLAGRIYEPVHRHAVLGAPMEENDTRQDYVRASLHRDDDRLVATPFAVQDSSMLKFFADADALIVRQPFARPAQAGEPCEILLVRP